MDNIKKNKKYKSIFEIRTEREIRREKYFKDIDYNMDLDKIFNLKLIKSNVKNICELECIVYDFIDNVICFISKDDEELFRNYIKERIILQINEYSKFVNQNKEKINYAKRGILETCSRYSIVKEIILPKIQYNNMTKDDMFINYKNAFRNFISNTTEDINRLTLSPLILAYIFLNNKNYGYIKEKQEFKYIIKKQFNQYSPLDLFEFYVELDKFIKENSTVFLNNKKYSKKDLKKYLKIGYDNFEDIFKGNRMYFILSNIGTKEKMNKLSSIDRYKVILYLSILLKIPDIYLSNYKIKNYIDKIYDENFDQEKFIVNIIQYINLGVYDAIEYYIELSIKQLDYKPMLENCYDKFDNISFYINGIKKYKDFQDYSIYKLDSIGDEIFQAIKICEEYIIEEDLLKKIFRDCNFKNISTYSKNINKQKEILNIILGIYIQTIHEYN